MEKMQVPKFDFNGIKPKPQFKHNVEVINKITLNLHMLVNKHACSLMKVLHFWSPTFRQKEVL